MPQIGNALRGVTWNGSLSGLLDNVTTRLGLSWRYEYGRIAIFWLNTRNFAINFMDGDVSFVLKTVSGTSATTGIRCMESDDLTSIYGFLARALQQMAALHHVTVPLIKPILTEEGDAL